MQVKEAYGQHYAVFKVFLKFFKYARNFYLLCDNKNLSAIVDSRDPRVARWQEDIEATMTVQRQWVPGEWNTIADFGSRTVRADPAAALTEEEADAFRIDAVKLEFSDIDICDIYIHAIVVEQLAASGQLPSSSSSASAPAGPSALAMGGAGGPSPPVPAPSPVVPGHAFLAPMLKRVISEQQSAPEEERGSWTGAGFKTVIVFGQTAHLYHNRVFVPKDCKKLQEELMAMAHDHVYHYEGANLTLDTLRRSAKVHWEGMSADIVKYIASCVAASWPTTSRHPRRALSTHAAAGSPPHLVHRLQGPYATRHGLPHGRRRGLQPLDPLPLHPPQHCR